MLEVLVMIYFDILFVYNITEISKQNLYFQKWQNIQVGKISWKTIAKIINIHRKAQNSIFRIWIVYLLYKKMHRTLE